MWLCRHIESGQLVAVKQIPKSKNNEMNYRDGLEELKAYRRFFKYNGVPFDTYKDMPGIESLCTLIDSQEDKQDLWMVFELCGQSLSKVLFKTKGEFYQGERIYEVIHNQQFYDILQADNCYEFKRLLQKILQVLELFKSAGLVHCDLKTENIMVDVDYQQRKIKRVKVIDLGSSFKFDTLAARMEMTTPEYLPPEILEWLEVKKIQTQPTDISMKLWEWSIDMWSLGIILVEVMIGYPVWLSYKGRIVHGASVSQVVNTGPFGVQGRLPAKISKL